MWTVNDALEETSLLVNKVGPYSGRRPVNLEDIDDAAQLSIEADGNWTVTLEPFTSMRHFGKKGTFGAGDDVVFLQASAVFNITHDGSENFIVWDYATDGTELVVNEIGAYSGQHIMSEGIIVVAADGAWTITP